ncbi:MAG: hypothetical protein IPN01_24235, partial [Deltaproteobacteria bacterium]|nr:hypothetical protein [Deltaproteobacteria bacterium]
MTAPVIIGLTELEQQPWADVGAIVMAHALGSYGYRVVLMDGDPCSAVLGQWGSTLPQEGPSLLRLMRSWMMGFVTAPATDEVLEILQDAEIPGDVGFVRAADAPMTERPGAPTPRAVQAARDALRRSLVARERAQVVIVRLPPLSTALGLSLAAQLVDVLVPLVPQDAVRGVALALSQVMSLRGAALRVLPVEVNRAEDWSPEDAEEAWLGLTQLVPIARVRPAILVESADDGRIGLPMSLAEDFTLLTDAVREAIRLPHPDAVEQVWEADAREDGPAAYAGFMRLIEADPAEAMRFFKKSLAGRGATRRSAVEALRAMVDSGVVGEEGIAEAFKYVVQKFRPEEPDALAEYVNEVGRSLLNALRAGALQARAPRVLIDVADALVSAAVYRQKVGQAVSALLDEAEVLLLEASRGVDSQAEVMRLAEALGRHARAAKHGRHADLAIYLVIKGMQMGVAQRLAEETTLT